MTLTPFLVIGFANNMILFDLVFEKAQRAEGIAKLQKILQEKVVGKKRRSHHPKKESRLTSLLVRQ